MPDVKFFPIKNSDYNYRINLKNEEELDNLSYLATDMKHKINATDMEKAPLKFYRYKKRFSFTIYPIISRIRGFDSFRMETYRTSFKFNSLVNIMDIDSRVIWSCY